MSKIFPTCQTGGGGHLPEAARLLLLEADLLPAACPLAAGLHHVTQVVLLVVALDVRVVVVDCAGVVVVDGSLVRLAPPWWRRRLRLLLLPRPQGRPDRQLPLDAGARVGAVQGTVTAVSVETVATD